MVATVVCELFGGSEGFNLIPIGTMSLLGQSVLDRPPQNLDPVDSGLITDAIFSAEVSQFPCLAECRDYSGALCLSGDGLLECHVKSGHSTVSVLVVDAEFLAPLFQGFCLALVFDEPVGVSIILLLLHGGPAAVAGLIVAVVVREAIDRMLWRWTRPHVGKER